MTVTNSISKTIRNITIIAHVDHGKTIIDNLMKQGDFV